MSVITNFLHLHRTILCFQPMKKKLFFKFFGKCGNFKSKPDFDFNAKNSHQYIWMNHKTEAIENPNAQKRTKNRKALWARSII